jgi:hypothetical protein
MPRRTSARRAGLSPKTSKGLTKKRIERKAAGSGKRVVFGNEDPTVTVQFLQSPDDFTEFEIHSFQEDGRWWFVPCAGDGCPLDDAEGEQQRRTSYRFAANVWNSKLNKVQVLEGPKTLAQQIFYRYQRKPSVFLKRVYDVTKFQTQPVSYNFELAEEDPISVRGKRPFDLDEYLVEEMKGYYGDDLELAAATLSDDDMDDDVDDDDDDMEDEDTDDELDDDEDDELEDEDDTDDEDDLDDDDDEDDEDDDEDDEPPARARRAPAKKAAPRKAPAKKAAPRKATSRRR